MVILFAVIVPVLVTVNICVPLDAMFAELGLTVNTGAAPVEIVTVAAGAAVFVP